MRSIRLYAFSLTTAAMLALAIVSPAAAEDTPIAVRAISAPGTIAAVPDTQYAGLAATSVTVGPETADMPCVDCVPGAGTPNIALAWPVFTVTAGSTLTITSLWQSTGYTGPCTSVLILKQGNTVVFSTSFPFPHGCAAGGLYGVIYTVPAPATTGFTTVIGSVSGGPNKSGANTFINVQ